ncbi:hypothetical protein DQP57_03815 [Mycobacterium colombiense]|uniref:Uncharacterized protein n=1 Tax=Mycobacterium colombiense TaxID=339268 RepID=A0A329M7Q9_9MYCO|nr:hypothetical protein DQP57_03815 [Mycobacterium colombiense]
MDRVARAGPHIARSQVQVSAGRGPRELPPPTMRRPRWPRSPRARWPRPAPSCGAILRCEVTLTPARRRARARTRWPPESSRTARWVLALHGGVNCPIGSEGADVPEDDRLKPFGVAPRDVQ